MRALNAERHLQEVSTSAAQPVQESQDITDVIQTVRLQATNAGRKRVEAAVAAYLQPQRSEADAGHESERAAWAEETQQSVEAATQKLQGVETEREEGVSLP